MLKKSLVALAALALSAGSAAAQGFPTKPVTIIVSTAAGSGMSATARLIADELEKTWKQSVIVDHRGGASGYIAAEVVGRAAPDGYTLVFGSDSFTAIRLFLKGNTFNPAKDLTPISLATWSPFLILTNPKLGPKTVGEFITLAKANPGKFNFGVIGRSQQTLEILRFSKLAGIKMEEITYQATAAALPQLMNNDLQFFLTSIASAGGQIKAGTLVPLATMGENRMKELPDLPTLKESGINQTAGFWFGFFGPPGMQKDLAEKISADVRDALQVPGLKARLEAQAYIVRGNTPAEYTRMIEAEMNERQETARANNIEPQ
jgi:tripartite-type tricarboxylate transporter receptor subunit TctC